MKGFTPIQAFVVNQFTLLSIPRFLQYAARRVMPFSAEDKLDLLLRVPLFEGLSEHALKAIAPNIRVLAVERRDELFYKGDVGEQLFVIVDGPFKALTTSREGDEVVFEVMGPGDVFGESVLMDGAPRIQTVRAIDSASLIALDRRDLLAFMRAEPEVALRLLARLTERVRALCSFFEDVHYLNLPERLARKLVALSERFGRQQAGSVCIDLRLSQEEWGDLVGATRESVNKQLKAWGEAGLVRRERGLLLIDDPAGIERLARPS